MLMNNNEYLDLVQTIKQEIQQAQYKATKILLWEQYGQPVPFNALLLTVAVHS